MVPSVNKKIINFFKNSPFFSVFSTSKYKTRACAASVRVVQCEALWKPGLRAHFSLSLRALMARNVGRSRRVLARNVMFVPFGRTHTWGIGVSHWGETTRHTYCPILSKMKFDKGWGLVPEASWEHCLNLLYLLVGKGVKRQRDSASKCW